MRVCECRGVGIGVAAEGERVTVPYVLAARRFRRENREKKNRCDGTANV